jgi:hypothetical protein
LPPPRSALRGSRTSGRVDHIDAFPVKRVLKKGRVLRGRLHPTA